MPIRKPNHIDRRIAANIKRRRKALNITVAGLAAALCISYQQLQKYEAGKNRMPASMLYEMARFLDIPVEWFFEETKN